MKNIPMIGAIEAIFDEVESVIEEKTDYLKNVSSSQIAATYRADLEKALKVVKEGSKEQRKLALELEREKAKIAKENLNQLAAYAETLEERQGAKKRLRELELQDEINKKKESYLRTEKTEKEKQLEKELRSIKNKEAVIGQITSAATNGMDKLYSQMSTAATTYSGYVDKISTRLFGANETFSSISKTVSQAFGSSAFFKMSTVFESISSAVSKGISYNIEERASMNVLATKVADTFDAFNDNLLRLIRVQQDDSTRARLGMESLLTQYLNKNYQDTSYLSTSSKSVSANLFEASSLRSTEDATELEYVVQKYLGSLSSVGVSSTLIDSLSKGIGYLASGDISTLSSNDSLQQLLVASANRGGGTSYGDMLTGTFDVKEVTSLFKGFYSLIQEISKTGASNNVVALSQYAKIFGMAVSDVTATLNITAEQLENISSDLASYDSMTQRVSKETTFAKLYSRTGGASIGNNLYQNFIEGAAKGIGQNAAGYLSWQLAGTLSGLLKGVETGIDMSPFGVGTHLNLSVGDIMKASTVAAGSLSGIASMISGLGSKGGVDLSALTRESRTTSLQRGDLLSMIKEGNGSSLVSYVGDYSEGALAQSANLATDKAAAMYSDEDYKEEQARMKKTQEKLESIGDNVAFIVQLLNESGIVIRGMEGVVDKATYNIFDSLASSSSPLGVLGG